MTLQAENAEQTLDAIENKGSGQANQPSTGTSNTGTSKGKSGTDGKNVSTPLGDGTSGEYTGGKGTYGGKATHGTGPGSDIKK